LSNNEIFDIIYLLGMTGFDEVHFKLYASSGLDIHLNSV